ncbi:hypothetical protein GCM10027028_59670 [Streptomyces sundarbansensis]
MRYGLGLWLHESTDTVFLIGYDAGVSVSPLMTRAPAPLTR